MDFVCNGPVDREKQSLMHSVVFCFIKNHKRTWRKQIQGGPRFENCHRITIKLW